MLLRLIFKTELASKSVKLHFLHLPNFKKKKKIGLKKQTLATLFRDFKIQFCVQISYLGVQKNQFSQKVEIKILGENVIFEQNTTILGIVNFQI